MTSAQARRAALLENNRVICELEGGDRESQFFNQIETRLGLPEELQTEADKRLGDAYVNSLAQYEAEGEYAGWSPLTIGHLVRHERVTMAEAGVIVIIAAREYPKGDEFTRIKRVINEN